MFQPTPLLYNKILKPKASCFLCFNSLIFEKSIDYQLSICHFINSYYIKISSKKYRMVRVNNRELQKVPIQQGSIFPYNCILRIQTTLGNGAIGSGTGFLIAADLLLTSANLFIYGFQQSIIQLHNINIYCQQKNITPQRVTINQGYLEAAAKRNYKQVGLNDYALVKLPQKIERKEYFKLKPLELHNRNKVTVCGFIKEEFNHKMCMDSGQIQIQEELGIYSINTLQGQGGSPVFLFEQNNQVVGIHKGSVNLKKYKGEINFCTPVTDKMIKALIKWEDYNVQSFIQNKQQVNQESQFKKNQSFKQKSRSQKSNKQSLLSTEAQPFQNQVFIDQRLLKPKISLQDFQNNFCDLKVLDLQGQGFNDRDVEKLCQMQCPNLREINLNDNMITLAAVVHLVNNKWNKQVDYILDAVRTKEGGLVLNVGRNIPIIKNLIKGDSIFHEEMDALNDSKELYEALYLMMQMPFEGKDEKVLKQSAEIQQQMKQTANDKQNSLDRLMLTIKQHLGDSRVTFTKKSNIKSQLTWKILTLQMMNKRVMIKHKIKEKQWDFEDFHNKSEHVLKFKEWYLDRLAQLQQQADVKDITIHELTEGSVDVWLSVDPNNFLLRSTNLDSEKISVVPFFRWFNLSPDDFDSGYQYEYPQEDKVLKYQRGGIPFFQPLYCKKFALKVQNLYDGGNDDWLNSVGCPGQWAVAFHGIRQPDEIIPATNQSILKAIMNGRNQGQMLKAGGTQVYQTGQAINKPGEQVGRGIYVSPYFTVCLLDYTYQTIQTEQKFHVVLMTRIRPEALKITSEQTYWVLNHSKDIRPYAILLFTPQQYALFCDLRESIYEHRQSGSLQKKPCHWDNWKDKYEQFIRMNNLD